MLTTFGTAGVLVCSDELNHASIIDGCRLARADVAVYRHRDLDHLRTLLRDRGGRRALVVSDTVFSMDGDAADVDALVELCAQEHALLVLDEAHAVLGPDVDARTRRRRAARRHLLEDARRARRLRRRARALRRADREPRPAVHLHDRAHTGRHRRGARRAAGRAVARRRRRWSRGCARTSTGCGPGHPSPIVPFVCGEEQRAIDAAAALLDHGVVVPAIRPPTVAPGTSRLRVALSAAHTDAQVDRLARRARRGVRRRLGAAATCDHAMTIVVVAGTGTEHRQDVGDRRGWRPRCRRRGIAVAARKPVQSFAPDRRRADRRRRARARRPAKRPHTVCPPHRWLPRAMAPPMAADALGLAPFTIAELAAEVTTEHARRRDRARRERGRRALPARRRRRHGHAACWRCNPRSSILVADAGLGTINLVRLSVGALAGHRVVVYLNRFDGDDELHVAEPRLARDARGPRGRHRPRGPRARRCRRSRAR